MNDLFPYAAPIILFFWFFAVFHFYRINSKANERKIMDRLAVYKVDYHAREVHVNRTLIRLHHIAEASALLRAPVPKDAIEELKSAFKPLVETYKAINDMCIWYYPTVTRNDPALKATLDLISGFKTIKVKYENAINVRKVVDEYIRHNPARPQGS